MKMLVLFLCCVLSCEWLFVTPWTVACQASLSVGFCQQDYWSRLSFSPAGDLPDPGIKPRSPALQADLFTYWATRESLGRVSYSYYHTGTVAHQAPLCMGFLRQEYWSRLPFPSLGYPSNPGIEPTLAGGFFTTVPPEKPPFFSFSFYPVIILFYLLD